MKGYKICVSALCQAWHQKMIGDQFRYAYEALNIQQYIEIETEEPIKVEEPTVDPGNIDFLNLGADPKEIEQ